MPSLNLELPELVVVTGTSSGLGREVGALLLGCGCKVVGVDLTPSTLDAKKGFSAVTGSVAEPETWTKVRTAIEGSGARRLGLVTSAAILDTGTVPESTPEIIARAMAVNVTGTALAMATLIPIMEEAKRGAVVAVASVNACLAEQQLAIYNATKAAVRQLARTAALDHARNGVRVNVLSPGPMMAGLFKRHLESATDGDKFLATRANRQPQGKILDALDVARAALFLPSDGASGVLGADLVADGGLTTGFDFRTGAEGASV